MKDSGAYLEHRLAGVHTVVIQGLNAGTLDLSHSVWGHQVLVVLSQRRTGRSCNDLRTFLIPTGWIDRGDVGHLL